MAEGEHKAGPEEGAAETLQAHTEQKGRSRRGREFVCSRRGFWRALLQEVMVDYGLVRGGQAYRLSDLGSLPDEQLAQVKPIVHPDCEIFLDQGHVCARFKGGTPPPLRLFPIEPANLAAFNMFNGQHTLDEAGQQVAQETGWDKARGFAHARDLFLALASRLVCVPVNPHEEE